MRRAPRKSGTGVPPDCSRDLDDLARQTMGTPATWQRAVRQFVCHLLAEFAAPAKAGHATSRMRAPAPPVLRGCEWGTIPACAWPAGACECVSCYRLVSSPPGSGPPGRGSKLAAGNQWVEEWSAVHTLKCMLWSLLLAHGVCVRAD